MNPMQSLKEKRLELWREKISKCTHDEGFLYCEDEDHIEFEPVDFDVEVMEEFLQVSMDMVESEALKVVPCAISSWCELPYNHEGNCKGHATYSAKI